ncbi:MAG: zinc ribbon domain-containing protein [Oscillospiraceae bacterium]|nr:zinc ribbon domain-containing protein [Oscillospiraceae bacterium]
MALIKCPECSKEISDKADACIGCGYPMLIITCAECNKEISNNVNACIECGCPVEKPTSEIPPQFTSSLSSDVQSSYNPQPIYQNNPHYPNQQGDNQNQKAYYQQALVQNEKSAKDAATSSLYAGIGGVLFALTTLLAIYFSVIALVFSIIAVVQGNRAKKFGFTGKEATAGKILGAISLLINCVIVPAVWTINDYNYY